MEPIANIAVKAAREAGEFIARAFSRLEEVEVTNKGRADYTSEVDRQAELMIIETIRLAYPSHGVVGEEHGVKPGDDWTWVIDPLDGTMNFLRGIPHFCVSIGVKHKGKLEHGVVYDPFKDELFVASRGAGARLNDRRLRVAKRTKLDGCLLATYLPFRRHDLLKPQLACIEELFVQVDDVRCLGSAALDLAYVAAGRFDGYWEMGLYEWDLAAGALLIKEAGGLVADFEGKEGYLETGNVVAGNPKIFKSVLKTVHQHFSK